MPKAPKIFLCIWGAGYMKDDRAIMEEHPIGFFTVDLGYGFDVREKLQFMDVGDCVSCNEITTCHTIVRIQ